jgi:hypothetical protein
MSSSVDLCKLPFQLGTTFHHARGNIRIIGCCCLWLRESEHQPRLIGYPMRVQLHHLIEQLLVGCRGFLQPIERPVRPRFPLCR